MSETKKKMVYEAWGYALVKELGELLSETKTRYYYRDHCGLRVAVSKVSQHRRAFLSRREAIRFLEQVARDKIARAEADLDMLAAMMEECDD